MGVEDSELPAPASSVTRPAPNLLQSRKPRRGTGDFLKYACHFPFRPQPICHLPCNQWSAPSSTALWTTHCLITQGPNTFPRASISSSSSVDMTPPPGRPCRSEQQHLATLSSAHHTWPLWPYYGPTLNPTPSELKKKFPNVLCIATEAWRALLSAGHTLSPTSFVGGRETHRKFRALGFRQRSLLSPIAASLVLHPTCG